MRYQFTPELIEKFWQRVDRSGGPDACWDWTGASNRGYGYLWLEWHRKRVQAHRVSYILAHGEIPDDRPCILHRCDRPCCCNPRHLFAGTMKDNTHDMMRKGRAGFWKNRATGERNAATRPGFRAGTRNGRAKLNDDLVRIIRARHANGETNMSALAREYGMSVNTIRKVIRRELWPHVH